MSSKLQVFLMIPVLFMETIPSLYNSLTKLVYGVTLLIGRVVCERFRRSKGYGTCFNHVFPDDFEKARVLIPEAMSEFAQATPPSSQKSHAHHIVHYPKLVDLLGSLSGQWMFGDERRNNVCTLTCCTRPRSVWARRGSRPLASETCLNFLILSQQNRCDDCQMANLVMLLT